ncbi:lysoplasmalogenase [Corynebacterium crudilactis]|uniref:lysoplasmalogenase n=1 Tax=Corynebacterium crudilactis TaxID=1652495 RepID=UPI001FE218BC|nr:lysoplasmalogenase [Corynebacterium crudilactis]
MTKTRQGATALVKAVAKSASEPERAAFVAAASINIGASLLGVARAKKLSKPVLMPLLAGRVLRSSHTPGEKALGIAGLGGGWAGDLVLMKPNSLPQGAAGFAINHAAYITLLLAKGARPSTLRTTIRAVPLAAAAGFAALREPKLVPMVLSYGGLLATTSLLADDPHLHDSSVPASFGLGHGGNLFLISDAVLFAREMFLSEGTPAAQCADGMVMGTYTIAQLLLVDGLFSK